MVDPKSRQLRLLYIHDSKDEDLRKELENHLTSLVHADQFVFWHMGLMTAGSAVDLQLAEQAERAHVVLLLLSADFLASVLCQELLEKIRRAQAKRNLVLVPILARPVDFCGSGLAELQVLPRNRRPVTLWDNHDAAWLDVVQSLRRLLPITESASAASNSIRGTSSGRDGDDEIPTTKFRSNSVVRGVLVLIVTLVTLLVVAAVRRLEHRLLPAQVLPSAAAPPSSPAARATVRYELVDELSSLRAQRSGTSLQITPDPEVTSILRDRFGSQTDDPQYQPQIQRWLRRQARRRELSAATLPPLVQPQLNLASLTLDHPELVAALLPTPAELASLGPREAELVQRWMRRYVGQWNPRLRFTIDNTQGHSAMRVIAVLYDVQRLAQAKGSTVTTPQLVEFRFALPYELGVHRFPLAAQGQELSVPKGEARSFDLVLTPSAAAPAAPLWLGVLQLETNQGALPIGQLVLQTFSTNQRAGPH